MKVYLVKINNLKILFLITYLYSCGDSLVKTETASTNNFDFLQFVAQKSNYSSQRIAPDTTASLPFLYGFYRPQFIMFNFIRTTQNYIHKVENNMNFFEIKMGYGNVFLTANEILFEFDVSGYYKNENAIISKRKGLLIPKRKQKDFIDILTRLEILNINNQFAEGTGINQFGLSIRLSNVIDTTYTISQTDKETIQKCQTLQQLITNEISTTKYD